MTLQDCKYLDAFGCGHVRIGYYWIVNTRDLQRVISNRVVCDNLLGSYMNGSFESADWNDRWAYACIEYV